MSPELERLAWLVLRTANRMQAKGSTARIVVPRDPELTDVLGPELGSIPTDDDLLSAEEYLEENGFLETTYIGLTRGTYTITPAGLRWIERGSPGATEMHQAAREEEDPPGLGFASGGDREASEPTSGVSEDRPGGVRGSRRPWWRRVLGR